MQEFLNSFEKLEFQKIKSDVEKYLGSSFAKKILQNTFPKNSADEIKREIKIISELKVYIQSKELHSIFIPETILNSLQSLSIEGNFLSTFELRDFLNFYISIRSINFFLFQKKNEIFYLNEIANNLFPNKILEFHIEQSIDENGNVKNTASKNLKKIREQIAETSIYVRKKIETILKQNIEEGFVQDDIITVRDGRMVIPIKSEYKNKVYGIIHSESSSGLTAFVEPFEVFQLNNNLRILIAEEKKEIEIILKELSKEIFQNYYQIKISLENLSYLEFAIGKTKYALEIKGEEVEIDKNNFSIYFENACHPLLFHKHKFEEIVPFTFDIGKNFNTMIITGPNAGGKTVALKTIGLLIIMLQSGFQIPVSQNSKFTIVEKLFADIGDNQSIESDLSTFSSHIENLKTILNNADDKSIVLIDEIGSGTEPKEGSAISSAVLETLSKKNAITIATTHHTELKAFASQKEKIINAGMEFDKNFLKPTYILHIGIPGNSYAFEIAKRLDFPNDVLNNAKTFVGESSINLEKLLFEIETQKQLLQSEVENLQNEKNQLEKFKTDYEIKLKKIKKDENEILLNANKEAQKIIDDAKKIIEKTVRDIKEKNAEKNVVTDAKKEISSHLKKIENSIQKEIEIKTFSIGEFVKINGGSEVGEIVSIADNNEYWIAFPSMKIKLCGNEIESVSTKVGKHILHMHKISTSYKTEIDLRGMYGDEAIEELQKFLDEKILENVNRIKIIHGKGTGSLRKKISMFLSQNSFVNTYQLADYYDGGSGVTIVELKS